MKHTVQSLFNRACRELKIKDLQWPPHRGFEEFWMSADIAQQRLDKAEDPKSAYDVIRAILLTYKKLNSGEKTE